MPKISITLDEVKQIISEKYFKKHSVSPCDIEIFDGGSLIIDSVVGQEKVSDGHYILSFEIDRLDI